MGFGRWILLWALGHGLRRAGDVIVRQAAQGGYVDPRLESSPSPSARTDEYGDVARYWMALEAISSLDTSSAFFADQAQSIARKALAP